MTENLVEFCRSFQFDVMERTEWKKLEKMLESCDKEIPSRRAYPLAKLKTSRISWHVSQITARLDLHVLDELWVHLAWSRLPVEVFTNSAKVANSKYQHIKPFNSAACSSEASKDFHTLL